MDWLRQLSAEEVTALVLCEEEEEVSDWRYKE